MLDSSVGRPHALFGWPIADQVGGPALGNTAWWIGESLPRLTLVWGLLAVGFAVSTAMARFFCEDLEQRRRLLTRREAQ